MSRPQNQHYNEVAKYLVHVEKDNKIVVVWNYHIDVYRGGTGTMTRSRSFPEELE